MGSRRLPEWSQWMVAGCVGGGLVTAIVGPIASALVELTTSPLSQETFRWGEVSLGAFGWAGGLFVGFCCAGVTSLASDPDGASMRGHAAMAGVMTAVVVLPLAALAVLPPFSSASLTGALVVVLGLVAVVALPAAALGAFVYVWSHGPPEQVRRWSFGLAGGLVAGAVLVAGVLVLGTRWAPSPAEAATECPPFGDVDMGRLDGVVDDLASTLGGHRTVSECGSTTLELDRRRTPAGARDELIRLGWTESRCRGFGRIGSRQCTGGDPPIEASLWGDGKHLQVGYVDVDAD